MIETSMAAAASCFDEPLVPAHESPLSNRVHAAPEGMPVPRGRVAVPREGDKHDRPETNLRLTPVSHRARSDLVR